MPTRGKLRIALTAIRYALYYDEDNYGAITEIEVLIKHRKSQRTLHIDLQGDTVTTDA